MRVLLLQSPLGRRENPVTPLGLTYLAGALGDHDVRLIDTNVASEAAAIDAVRSWKPDVVGVSLRNIDTTQVKDPFCFFKAFRPFVQRVRAVTGPDIPIVTGGPGFSLFARPVMERVPEVDFGVYLEGEITFPALLAALDDPASVPGVFYRDDGGVVFTGPGPRADFRSVNPRLDLLDVDAYAPFAKNYSIGIQTQRGCVLECAYCTYTVLSGTSLRTRPVEDVLDEIGFYVDHGIDQVFFADAVFNIPPKHAAGIAEGILSRGMKVKWRAYHNERTLTPEYMKLAVRSGCTEFSFSPDAWSKSSLRLLQKNIRTEDIEHSLQMVKQTPGAMANYNFFLGLPGQDVEELGAILKFWLRCKRVLGRRLQGYRISYVRVEPDTPIHAALIADGTLSPDDPLLPETDREVAALFHRTTGNRAMDLICRYAKIHRWPLSRRLVPQVGDEWWTAPLPFRRRPDVVSPR